MKFTVEEFFDKLPLPANEKCKEGVFDVEALKKGNVSLVFFSPRSTNHQTFHDEDEFYFIAQGSANLIIETEQYACEAGDAFYVPAQVPHHFENFSKNFAV